jgi:hypothetical protein
MKRSNLFLAVTTGCLAIASFAFAKAHKLGAIHTGYCTRGVAPHNCTVVTQNKNWSTIANGSRVATCSNGKTAFTQQGACGKVLFTVAG